MANPMYGQNKADNKMDVLKDTHITSAYNVVADSAVDTTITVCKSGHEYHFGTSDGVLASSDSDNAFTFQLPTPKVVGEKIKITCLTAAAYAKLLGFSTAEPATVTITYIANDNGVFIESAPTIAGVDGTANTMVKLSNSHFQIGDTYEAIALSTTKWLLTINGRNGLIATGDIAVAAGNVLGYIS